MVPPTRIEIIRAWVKLLLGLRELSQKLRLLYRNLAKWIPSLALDALMGAIAKIHTKVGMLEAHLS